MLFLQRQKRRRSVTSISCTRKWTRKWSSIHHLEKNSISCVIRYLKKTYFGDTATYSKTSSLSYHREELRRNLEEFDPAFCLSNTNNVVESWNSRFKARFGKCLIIGLQKIYIWTAKRTGNKNLVHLIELLHEMCEENVKTFRMELLHGAEPTG